MSMTGLGRKCRIGGLQGVVNSVNAPSGILTFFRRSGATNFLATVTFVGLLVLGGGCNTWRTGTYPAPIRPSSLETSRLLSNAHYYKVMGRPEAALKEMEEAYRADPNNLKIADALAQNYQELGQFQRAQEIYQEVLSRHNSNRALHNNLCFSFYLQGNLAKAESCFRKALERDPSNLAARNNLGLLWCRQGKLADAQRLWEEAEGTAGAQARMTEALAFLGMEAPTNYARLLKGKPQPSQAVTLSKPATPAAAACPAKHELAAASPSIMPTPPPALAPKVEQQVPAKPAPSLQVAAPQQAAASTIFASTVKAMTKATTTGKVFPPASDSKPSKPELKEDDRPSPPSPSLTALERETALIEVRNGNGTRHLARQTASLLYQEVFNVAEIGDHIDFGAKSTVIYCRPGAERVAQEVNWQIFPKARIEANSKLKDGVAIKIVLGRDLLDQPFTMARLAEATSEMSPSAGKKTKPPSQPRAEAAKNPSAPVTKVPAVTTSIMGVQTEGNL